MPKRPAENPEQPDDFVSKSQKKREMAERQELGTQLVNLTDSQLAKMPLDDELRDAVLLARKIRNKHEGYRRQLQFIGKLMRLRDIAPIEQALNNLKNAHQQQTSIFHEIETTRDKLLHEGDDALQEFIEEHPQADRQKLRQLIRLAEKQQTEQKPPVAARQLFVYLRELLG
ncbi:ribosome-associated protein [Idiomarina sp. M1R2S28]|uniref:Dual-action ribosomal maturation protein DarP n=1 Tax=Idiomarina rhizosphaerae TaxID=2961572 RepID=A0A9X2FT02_9GAMM|nr:ribosome biogenesis factor YjgA [Idiomarina rhizosphaerae]MCP1338704.1 ribosome-associated protein [Idiomarina rhizosphaerae]